MSARWYLFRLGRRFPPSIRVWAKRRPAAGRWGLRTTAIVYLGAMIALPVVAMLGRGCPRDWVESATALGAPGAIERDQADPGNGGVDGGA